MLSENKLFSFSTRIEGMQNALRGLKPIDLRISYSFSFVQQGPMENIPNYINRKHGVEKIEYMHASLSEILSKYGILLSRTSNGSCSSVGWLQFSFSRYTQKSHGKKDKKEMEMQKEKFIAGANKIDIKQLKRQKFLIKLLLLQVMVLTNPMLQLTRLLLINVLGKAYYPHEFFASLMTYDQIMLKNSQFLSVN